tara:strand:+ start:540 stop:1274 length:735 start_codon:yes stop_codon:yes gene_type:complete
MFSNNLALALFFLYFVLMSGQTYELMNCGLQRAIDTNVPLKQFMMFASIFLFTYILNWYSLEHIDEVKLPTRLFATANIENFEGNNTENNDDTNRPKNVVKLKRLKYIVRSFFFSILIYVIFVLSSKNEGIYSVIFFIGISLIVVGTIFKTTINYDIVKNIGNEGILTFITPSQMNQLKKKYENLKDDVIQLTILQNTMSVISILIVIFLLIGSYKYYLKQSVDYSENWSWLKFIFGTSKCESL